VKKDFRSSIWDFEYFFGFTSKLKAIFGLWLQTCS